MCREWVAAHNGWVKRGDFGPLFLCPELSEAEQVIGEWLAGVLQRLDNHPGHG